MKYKIFQSSPWIDGVEKKFLLQTIKNNWITEGPLTRRFLLRIKKIRKSKHVELAPNGTLGLYLALKALNLPKNSEVIVPNFTFYASASSVIFAGLIPKFVDVNMDDFNMNHNNLEKLIKKQTKAIMIVHAYGQSARMKEIISIAKKYKLKIIEDAAQVFNVFYNKKHCGTLGDVGVISFYGDKSLTTGEGAAILTQNKKIAKRIKFLRNQGRENSGTFKHKEIGMNFRMTDLQGAIGYIQTEKLQGFISERAKWDNYYRENLSQIDWLRLPDEPKEGAHAWQAFVTYIKPRKAPQSRNQIMDSLQKKGIFTRPGTHALHLLGAYQRNFNFNPLDFPIAKKCDDNTMAIPLHNCMKEEDFAFVVKSLKEIC